MAIPAQKRPSVGNYATQQFSRGRGFYQPDLAVVGVNQRLGGSGVNGSPVSAGLFIAALSGTLPNPPNASVLGTGVGWIPLAVSSSAQTVNFNLPLTGINLPYITSTPTQIVVTEFDFHGVAYSAITGAPNAAAIWVTAQQFATPFIQTPNGQQVLGLSNVVSVIPPGTTILAIGLSCTVVGLFSSIPGSAGHGFAFGSAILSSTPT